jgi:hypothetical protein
MIKADFCLAFAVLAGAVSMPASAQTWDYIAYMSDGRPSPGTISVTEKDGETTLVMTAAKLDKCVERPLKASVVRNSTDMEITPVPAFRGCPEFRFRIKLDGSGGALEVKRGNEWVVDPKERRLTPAKCVLPANLHELTM